MNEPVSLAIAFAWGIATAVLLSLYVRGDSPGMRAFGLVAALLSFVGVVLWSSTR